MTGTLVGLADHQTLTNKTIEGTDNPDLQVFPLNIDHGKNANTTTFHRGDGIWQVPDYPIPPTASHLTNALSGDVSLPYNVLTTGLQVAQGTSGTWLAVASISLNDAAAFGGTFIVQMSDGTTVIASAAVTVSATQPAGNCTLTGVIVHPAANIRVAVLTTNISMTGVMVANASTYGKDSVLSVVQLL